MEPVRLILGSPLNAVSSLVIVQPIIRVGGGGDLGGVETGEDGRDKLEHR
jgi:hypothetical protein